MLTLLATVAALYLVLVALLINLPFAHSAWTRHRIAQDGITTTVEVVDAEGVPDDDPEIWFISYQFPEEIEEDQKTYDAEVDEETWNFASTSKQVRVRYLEDNPSAHVVQGEVRRMFPWVLLGLGDLALLAFFGPTRFDGRPHESPPVMTMPRTVSPVPCSRTRAARRRRMSTVRALSFSGRRSVTTATSWVMSTPRDPAPEVECVMSGSFVQRRCG